MSEPRPRRRPRLSLLSLLLLVAVAATSLMSVQLWREVGPLRVEVRRLRNETGQLTVVDPEKIYAVAIATMDENTWKWRVHLPAGHNYRLVTNVGRIAGRPPGMPRADWFSACGFNCAPEIQSGELMLTVTLSPDPTHSNGPGHWNVRVRSDRGLGGVCGTLLEWLDDRRAWSVTSDARVDGSQVELDVADGVELLTIRRAEVTEDGAGGWEKSFPDETQDGDGVGVRIVAW